MQSVSFTFLTSPVLYLLPSQAPAVLSLHFSQGHFSNWSWPSSTTSLDLLHCPCTVDTSSAHISIICDPRRQSWAPATPDFGRPGLKQVLTTNGPTLLSPPCQVLFLITKLRQRAQLLSQLGHSQREMKRPSSYIYCWWDGPEL